jgi:hypothetical protein
MKRFYVILRLALFCPLFILSSCLPNNTDNENKDWAEEVLLTVAPEIADFYSWESNVPSDGINIKEDKANDWEVLSLKYIEGFNYEVGYKYRLKVLKTHLAFPPADGFDIKYKLLETISKEKQ